MSSSASGGRLLRLLLAMGASLVLAAAALVVALVAASNGLERERVRALVEGRLAAALGVPVAIGGLEGTLHRAPLLRDVRLGPEDAPLLQAREVRVEIAAFSVWPPALDLAFLHVDGLRGRWPEVQALWDDAEAPPGTDDDASADEGLPLRVRIGRGVFGIEAFGLRAGETTADAAGELGFDEWVLPAGPTTGLPLPVAAHALLDVALDVAEGGTETARVAGTLEADLASGILTLRPSRFAAAPESAGDGLGASFASLELAGHTRVAPWLAGEVDGEAELRGQVTGLDLSRLLADPLLAPELGTELSGDVEVRPVGADEVAFVLDLAGPAGAVGAADAVHAEGRLRGEGWTLETARIRAPALRLDASGAGTLARLDRLVAELSGEAALLAPWLPDPPLAGSVRASVEATRQADGLHSRVVFASEALEVADLGPLSVDVAARARDLSELTIEHASVVGDDLHLELDPGATVTRTAGGVRLAHVLLRAAGGTLTLEGEVDAEGFHGFAVDAHGFDVQPIAVLLPEVRATGMLEGGLRLDGPFSRLDARGELAWRDGTLVGEPFEDVRLEVAPDGDRLRARGVARLAEEEIAVALALPRDVGRWNADRLMHDSLLEADLDVVEFDLEALAPFLPVIPNLRDARGLATGAAQVRGSAAGLDVHADLALADTTVYVVPIGRRLGPAHGRLVFDGGRFTAHDVVVEGDEGEIRLAGSLAVSEASAAASAVPRGAPGFVPEGGLAIRVEADHFSLRFPPLVPAGFVDGTLELTGSLEEPVVRGDLAVSGLQVRIPHSAGRIGSEFRVAQGAGTRFEEPKATGPQPAEADMDVRVQLSDPAHVKGQGLALLIEGDLRYRAEPGRVPAWFGTGRVVRGSASAFGKTFVVQRGEAVLVGEAELDPRLDVRARYPVADVVLIGIIEGRASAPTIRLDSEPPLPEDDRLSYLLFGRPLGAFDGTGDANLSTMAAQMAGGVALSELNEMLGGRLPIDQFTVEMGEEGQTEVGIGASLGERTTIRSTTEIGGEAETEFEVEYRFAPGWSVRGTTSDDGHAGADLIWSKSY